MKVKKLSKAKGFSLVAAAIACCCCCCCCNNDSVVIEEVAQDSTAQDTIRQ